MKEIIFTSSNPVITSDDWKNLELQIEKAVPKSFKDFILKNNEGSTEEPCIQRKTGIIM